MDDETPANCAEDDSQNDEWDVGTRLEHVEGRAPRGLEQSGKLRRRRSRTPRAAITTATMNVGTDLLVHRVILPGIGALRLSEATVPRIDEFITAVRDRSGTAAAEA